MSLCPNCPRRSQWPLWLEGDRAGHHHVHAEPCLRWGWVVGSGAITAIINSPQTFYVPSDCRQELEYLNTNPQMTALIDMSFSELMSLRTVLSPLSLVELGAKTLKHEFYLIGSEFGVLFAVLILYIHVSCISSNEHSTPIEQFYMSIQWEENAALGGHEGVCNHLWVQGCGAANFKSYITEVNYCC